jgi:DNA invertase Pin-like site-specific DNA recombinase
MQPVAIYYRVSTDRQDLAMQKTAIAQWLATKHPLATAPIEIEDVALSGSRADRPGFQRLLQLAREHQIDTVIVYRLDRFSRDAATAIRAILDLDGLGVAFVATDQPALNLGSDVPFRRTILMAFAEIAQIERETIIARVKMGLQAARAKGTHLGRPPLADDVRAKVRSLRAQGWTFARIAQETQLSQGSINNILHAKRDAC